MSTPTPIPPPIPSALDLDKSSHLSITWADGSTSTYPIAYLRKNCPCASCKVARESAPPSSPVQTPTGSRLSLSVLPGSYTGPLAITSADLVGNYALRLEWADGHDTGIYSFAYLHDIRQPADNPHQ